MKIFVRFVVSTLCLITMGCGSGPIIVLSKEYASAQTNILEQSIATVDGIKTEKKITCRDEKRVITYGYRNSLSGSQTSTSVTYDTWNKYQVGDVYTLNATVINVEKPEEKQPCE